MVRDPPGTVTQSNSPLPCSCANSGRLRTNTLKPPGGDDGRVVVFLVPSICPFVPSASVEVTKARLHRCTAAANGLAFIRRDSLLSNICRVDFSAFPFSGDFLATTKSSGAVAAVGFFGALAAAIFCFASAAAPGSSSDTRWSV